MDQQTICVTPRGAYGFGLVLAYLRSSPSAIVEHVTAHGFQRALDIGPGVVIAVERDVLLPSPDPLQLTIWAEGLTPALQDQVVAQVMRMLLLDIDGAPIEDHLLLRDRELGRYVQQVRGFRPILLGSPWEALLWAVAGQLIGVEQSRIIKQRLVEHSGRAVSVGGTAWPLPPSPNRVLEYGIEPLRTLGLSRAKAIAIHEAATAIQTGALDLGADLPRAETSATLAYLQTIPGIGPWTTAMVALRGYGALDALPDGDAGLQSIVARHSTPASVRLTAEGLRERGALWAPYRGWATYLWWLQLQAEAMVRQAEGQYERGRRG